MQVRVQGRASGGEAVLAVRVGVDSGEHGAARRAAGSLGDIGNIELDAAGGEGGEVGRFDGLVAVATELDAKVVGSDEQDIEPLFFGGDHALYQQ